MRPSRRLLSSLHLLLYLFFCAVPARTFAQGVPGPGAAATSDATQAAPLPKEWDDAVGKLAEEIANAAHGPGAISIEMKNISSLSSTDASAIGRALQDRLATLHFKVVPSSQTGALQVEFTLSESANAYVWAAQTRGASTGIVNPVAIVSVTKSSEASDVNTKRHVALDKRLVWEQPGRFLDVAVLDYPVYFFSYRVVLEPTRIVSYKSSDAHWDQMPDTVRTLESTKWLRTVYGRIETNTNDVWVWDGDPKKSNSPSIHCSGQLEFLKQVQCAPWNRSTLPLVATWELSGHEDSASAELWQRCGPGSILLSTGNGDWTQPDSVQAYLVTEPARSVAPSSDPMLMDGPVISLIREDRGNTARAIVRNLITGNYEAYIVTATCSQ